MKTPILDALITMMEEVVKSKLPLHMDNIFEDRDAAQFAYEHSTSTDIHNCGTACCIVGYAAFDSDVILAANVTQGTSPGLIATDIWSKLEFELGDDFADSIAGSDADVRMSSATRACLRRGMPVDWLQEYPHLSAYSNTDEPQDAVDYMKELWERLSTHTKT